MLQLLSALNMIVLCIKIMVLAVRAKVGWSRQNHWDKEWDMCASNNNVEARTPDIESGLTEEQALEHDLESGLSMDQALELDELPHINVASAADQPIINPGYQHEFGNRDVNRGDRPMVGQKRQQKMPCIFARGQEPTSPPAIEYTKMFVRPGSVPSTSVHGQPLTFCSVHKNSGFLRLLEIIGSENYTRIEVNHPTSKITHRYNNCVLEFPPTENLFVFRPDDDEDAIFTPPNPILHFPDPPVRPVTPPSRPSNPPIPPARPAPTAQLGFYQSAGSPSRPIFHPPLPARLDIHHRMGFPSPIFPPPPPPQPRPTGSPSLVALPPPLLLSQLGFFRPVGSLNPFAHPLQPPPLSFYQPLSSPVIPPPPPPQVSFDRPVGSSNPPPACPSRPPHQSFQQPTGPSRPAAKPVEYEKKFCEECRKPLANFDWYLYRSKIFCSEHCRYANTLDAVVLQKPMDSMGSSSRNNIADVILNVFEVPTESLPSSSHDKEDEKGKGLAVVDEDDEEIPPEECPRKDKGKGILYIG